MRAGRQAMELLPETKDAFDGPLLTISLARIHTFVGEHAEALALLERSAETPAGITRAELRLDPTWDVLRQNPRFQKLVGPEPRR